MKTKLHRITYIICCAALIAIAVHAGERHNAACSECKLAIGKKHTASWAKLPFMNARYRKI